MHFRAIATGPVELWPLDNLLAPNSAKFRNGYQSGSPAAYYYTFQDWQNLDRFTGSVVANFNPFSWLRNRGVFGIDLNAEEATQFAPFGALSSLNPLGQKENDRQTVFNVSFDPVTTGQKTATATFSTNDPNNATVTVCLSGEGAP